MGSGENNRHSKLERGWKTLSWGFQKCCFRLLFFLFSFLFLIVQGGEQEGSIFCFYRKDAVPPNLGLQRFEEVSSSRGVGA